MGVRVPANFTELIFRMKVDGDSEEMLCTIGVGEDFTGFGQAQANDCAATWVTMMKIVTPEVLYVGMTARVGPDGQGLTFEAPRNDRGTYAGNALPPNCAALVQKRTGLGGRRNRGRLYLPGIPEAAVGPAGLLIGTYPAGASAEVQGWFTALAAVGGISEPYLFHTTDPLTAGIPPTIITSVTLAPKIATQRRRLR